MSFDRSTRNLLARMVGQAREHLKADVMDQLRRLGFQADGTVLDLDRIAGLSEAEREVGRELRALLAHFVAQESGPDAARRQAAYDRLAREIGFTTLNRLVALRMAEERDLIRQAVGGGLASEAFQTYEQLTHGALGSRAETYRAFVECLYDELAVDLPLLFDRATPESRIFPSERCLDEVLRLLNDAALAHLWGEDETIGWVYQYYNDPDERKRMREAGAPRNSRELAVRNQFFTPRYVVEFLTDNTLGRTWYEMRRGDTRLVDECRYLVRRPTEIFLGEEEEPPAAATPVEGLSQEELLRQPAYVSYRAKKDPRRLKVLDPACGSGHFLLYAFDLLATIYDEAYDDPDLGPPLQRDYPDRERYRPAVPGLILGNNLHGIDIDPRTCQIAALALWLRAQRAYQVLGLRGADRPRITRSHIVTAEPMPGERELLDEFVARLDPPLVGSLVRLVFDRMQLAGEAGPLLKIEEDLRHAIRQAKAQWQRQPKVQQLALLREFERRRIEQLEMFDLSGISDAAFWEGVEEQVFAALRAYATEAADGQATQRRLFADDAEQGFAFIDLLRQHYDVVLMNPPFGDAPLSTLSALDDQLATVGRDLGCAFVSAANRRWTPYGFTASVLSTAAWFQPSFSEWRFNNLFAEDRSLQTAAQLGGDVLDGATVNASAFTIGHKASNRAAIFRVFRSDDKALTIYSAIREIISGRASQCLYLVDLLQVGCLAGSPLAYWVSESLRNRLASLPLFQGNGGVVRQGTATGKEFRFSRAWWEIGRSNRWIPYMKSSEYSPFWDEPTWVLNFDRNGMELLATGKSRVQGTDYFGKPGVTFPSRSVLGFNPRAHPAGCAFSHTGSVVFGYRALPALILGYLSSKPIEYVLSLFTGSLQGEAGYHPQHYEVGVIQRLPWPEWDADAGAEIATHANNAALRSCGLFIGDETSHHFMAPYDFNKPSVLAIAQSERARELQAIREIIDLRGHIDLAVAPILGFTAEDIAEMDLEFAERVPPASGRWRVYFAAEPDPPDGVGTAFSMVSYAVGVLFGRWDVRLALECSLQPNLADPFSPLPVCSPGMLVGVDGLPAESGGIVSEEWLRARPDAITLPPPGAVQRRTIPDLEYPLAIAWDGILVDDEAHPSDVVQRVREVLALLWGGRWEAIEHEACELLGVRGLRDYFRRAGSFLADHLKRYSKSRRQAPIYWPLSTASGSYLLWLYYPRLTSDTLFTAVNRYVEPKLGDVERDLDELETDLRGASGQKASGLRKRVEDCRALLNELRDFREELLRVAALPYRPNLDDGVIINAAPLHKILRPSKWAKDTKAVWEKLERGDYDWAHLAYTLWPDRVRAKCRSDRSLAIAHGLEELYAGPPAKRRRTRAAIVDEDDEE